MRSAGIWRTGDGSRWFIVPDDAGRVEGPCLICSLTGDSAQVEPSWLTPFEVTETQARAWATHELGVTLDELKHGIDDKLNKMRQQLADADKKPVTPSSPITPNAASALLDIFKALPRVVGQGISGDQARVGDARQTMAELQRRLQEAGIEVDDRLQEFPARLADLRTRGGGTE